MRLAQLYPIQGQSIDHISISRIFNHFEALKSNFRSPLREAPKEKKVFYKRTYYFIQNHDNFGLKRIDLNTDSESFQCFIRRQAEVAEEA